MSQMLKCPCGRDLPVHATKARTWCAECVEQRRREQQTRKNHKKKTTLIYNRMLVNLTKNYVYMIEGLKR